jgi:hypothetical protein
MGDSVAPILRAKLAANPSLEIRRRLEQILANADTTPESLQQVRALETLEHIGTAAARQTIEALSKGYAEARLTREAVASLSRLRGLGSAPP